MGALNGWILLQGQIPAAAAKDNLFPKLFQKTNTNGSPILGIIFSSVLATLLMLSNYSKTLVEAFTYMMKLSTLTVLLPYLFSIATFALALKNTNTKSIILACLAFLFSVWIVIGCGAEIVFLGFLLLLLGIPVYVYLKKRQ
jgi:APA family basic amino acid/polyamine antiporter